MKKKNVLVFLTFFSLLLISHCFLFFQLSQYRTIENRRTTIRVLPLPPSINSILAGEFQGLTADFLYLDIAATLGGREGDNLTDTQWNEVEKMFATAIRLDPYFAPTFRAVQAYLPWLAKRPEHAIQLLMEVDKKRYWDWLPAFFIGFDYYFFLNEFKPASKFFFAAAKHDNAPSLLATLGARLAAETGDDEIGIDFLTRLLETTDNENEKKLFQDRITALQGQKELKTLIARYKTDHNAYPPNLHVLVFLRYTKNLPINPYFHTFFYQDGKVSFFPFSTKTSPQPPLPPSPLLQQQ